MQQHTSVLEFSAGASGLIATLSLQHSQHPFQSIELYISHGGLDLNAMQPARVLTSTTTWSGLFDTQVEIVPAQTFKFF